MRTLRLALPLAAGFASLFVAKTVFAQVTSITVNTSTVQRQDSSGNLYECPSRGSGNTVGCVVEGSYQGIGLQDCTDNTQLSFSLTIDTLPDPSGALQVWAGTGDCTQSGATNNSTTGICWPVTPQVSNPTTIQPITIKVTDIVAYLGVAPPLPPSYGAGSVAAPAPTSVCSSNAAASSTTTTTTDDSGVTTTVAGESTVNIFFMWFTNGVYTAPAVSSAAYPVKVKLVGPAQCTGVTAGSGDGLLLLNWTPPADTTIQGFNLYSAPVGASGGEGGITTVCDDASPTGTELLDDAGNPILDDAGNPIYVDDAGNPITENTDAGCYQVIVPPGTNSCVNGTGTIDTTTASITQINGTSNASGTISGLTNGTSYDVAVAAFDQFGNAGTLSNVVCASPAPIDDFWKIYNQDGGNAFCALEVVGKRGGSIVAAMLSIAGIVLLRRRRRKG